MYPYWYQACVLLLYAQAIIMPFIMVWTFWLTRRQDCRLLALQKEMRLAQGKRLSMDGPAGSLLGKLPKFQPLHCPKCGAGMLLGTEEVICPSCQHRDEVPKDYAVAISLKQKLGKMQRSALWHWRLANLLTLPGITKALAVIALAEPFVIVPTILSAADHPPDVWVVRALLPYMDKHYGLVELTAAVGLISWVIIMMILAQTGASLRKQLPVVPVMTKEVHSPETAACESCGGAIQYDTGEFATICPYCHVENYRVQFARRERAREEETEKQTTFALFGALQIIDECLSLFWAFGMLLVLVALIGVLDIAGTGLLNWFFSLFHGKR